MTAAHRSVPRPYVLGSVATVLLAVVATGVGLFVPGFYRDTAVLLPQLRGQDLLTLSVACPVLALSLFAAVRGSLRGYVVWLGVTGYLLYTYASYAFMATFNELYLVYVALFGVSLYTFVGGLVRLDATALKAAVGDRSVAPYVGFQLLVAFLVAVMWLADIVPAIADGTVPAVLEGTGLPVPVIQSLDLAVLVPAFVLSAYWLRQRRAWGYAFTAVLLVKAATLGLAVLAMALLQIRAGQTVPLPVLAVFGFVSVLALALTVRLVLAVGPTDVRSTAQPTAQLD